MTATKRLPTKETQHGAKTGEYLWWEALEELHRLVMAMVMDVGVCVCIEMTESLFIREDKSLGSTRVSSEFKVKTNAVGQQPFL